MSAELRRIITILVGAVIVVASFVYLHPAQAQSPELVFQVGDTVCAGPDLQYSLVITLSNFVDTVAGFKFWLQFDRPDLIQFQGSFDNAGSLASGWEFLEVSSLGGQNLDLQMVAVADQPGEPSVSGIAPQQDGRLLSLPLQVLDVPNTLEDRTVRVLVNRQPEHFVFSRPDGSSIGIDYDTIVDTSYFLCVQGTDTCLIWIEISGPPADSIAIDTIIQPTIDTNAVFIFDGEIYIIRTCCSGFRGNVDGDGVDQITVSDLSYLVDYLFKAGPQPPCPEEGDVDGSEGGGPDVADLSYLVDYLFRSGPQPPDCPNNP